MNHFTSLHDVGRIAAISDPVQRNYQITQSYFALSDLISRRTSAGANWCTFATWASRQAGQTIRREDMARALDARLKDVPALNAAVSEIAQLAMLKGSGLSGNAVVQMVWDTINPQTAMDRASAAVSRGNQKVYAEIGREFARFVEDCLPDTHFDKDNLEKFCAALRPGDPPDGQRYLRQAFARYYQAIFTPDTAQKAELMLLANLEIGFHEQTRLQPEIAAALEAAVEDPAVIAQRVTDALFPGRSWISSIRSFFKWLTGGAPTPLEAAIERFVALARQHIRLWMTDHLMELGFPNNLRLRLGHDLQHPYPANLTQLTNGDLIALLRDIDPTPDSLQDSGAVDWADLRERIHFIADMFRCFHESPELMSPPFEKEEITAIFGASPAD